jgi:uncharacterized protein YcbX
MPAGRVAQVWVFPVKSMRGVLLDAGELTEHGLRNDRAWAVAADDGSPVTAAQEPRLREVTPHLDGDRLTLDVPGAEPGLEPAPAAEAMSAWLGRVVRLVHRQGTGFVDVAPVHMVSRGSMLGSAHAEECDACDVREPRANLVLDLDAGGAAERGWVGSDAGVGAARLRVVRTPDHCLGVYAEVSRPGPVRVGDAVVHGAAAGS